MLILDTEPAFARRCSTVSFLRGEWEADRLPTADFLVYLRHTYRGKWGDELPIAPGTAEDERLLMYARELSGCW